MNRIISIFVLIFFCFLHISTLAREPIKKEFLCYGKENAPVRIIQYTAPSCGICALFMKRVFPKLHKEFIQTGQVYLVILDFPLNKIDMEISQIIRGSPNPCKYHKIIYDAQDKWVASKNPLETIKSILVKAGMSEKDVIASLSNTALADSIAASRLTAEKKYDIQGVPVFIIGAKEIDGLISWKKFKKIIESALQHVQSGKTLENFGK